MELISKLSDLEELEIFFGQKVHDDFMVDLVGRISRKAFTKLTIRKSEMVKSQAFDYFFT